MTVTINQINSASDTWQVLIDRLNLALAAISNNAVTADSTANGSPTAGNVYVSGTFGAQTIGVGSIRGGNVQSSAVLNVTSNVSVGNTTSNVQMAFGVDGGLLSVGANASMNASTLAILTTGVSTVLSATSVFTGNSTVYSWANQTAMTVVSPTSSTTQTSSSISVGNSTVNSVINSTAITVGAAQVNTSTFYVGATTVNSTSVGVGANTSVNTTAFFAGNSTVNSVSNSVYFRVGSAANNTVINSSGIFTTGVIDGGTF